MPIAGNEGLRGSPEVMRQITVSCVSGSASWCRHVLDSAEGEDRWPPSRRARIAGRAGPGGAHEEMLMRLTAEAVVVLCDDSYTGNMTMKIDQGTMR
jgi:hypothetical protein